MADINTFIARLNDVLSWELAGIIQNLNHTMMITGIQRLEYASFFSENSKENRDHAELLGSRITAYGGVPTVEPAVIRQAVTLEEMLDAALQLEKAAMTAWQAALDASEGVANFGTRVWLEDMIAEEQEHIDDLMKITGKISFNASQLPSKSRAV